ncbi:hypothetical protein J6590_097230, partial [Homalodisca vitripennis]
HPALGIHAFLGQAPTRCWSYKKLQDSTGFSLARTEHANPRHGGTKVTKPRKSVCCSRTLIKTYHLPDVHESLACKVRDLGFTPRTQPGLGSGHITCRM